MDAFIKLKKMLKTKKPVYQFQNRLNNYKLTQQNYLSLLLATVIELSLQPFSQYLVCLLKAGANVNFSQLQSKDVFIQASFNILMHACYKSNINIVSQLLDVQNINLNFVDSKGRNPIYYALLNESELQTVQILKLLLQKQPNFIEYQSYKTNYLKICIQRQRLQAIRLLIQKGIDPNIKILETGRYPIQQTIEFYQQKFKQKNENLISIKNKSQHNEYQKMRIKIIMFFIQSGANLDIKAQSQGTLRDQIVKKGLFNQQELQQLEKNLNKIKAQRESIKKHQVDEKEQEAQLEDQQNFLDEDIKKDLRTRNQTSQYNKFTQAECDYNLEQSSFILNSSVSFSSQNLSDDEEQENFSLIQRTQILSKQIQMFYQDSQSIYRKAWLDVQPFVKQLEYIAKGFMLQVDLIGSFATGLWTPFSDIDFILVTNQPYVDIGSTLGAVYLRLKKLKFVKQIFFIEEVKFPNIKILLSEQYNNLKIQVAIFHIKNNGKKYVQFINQTNIFYPQIKPIFFYIRNLLQIYNLHDRNKGGLKTYSLFLMISSLMNIFSNNTLGELLLNITRYYGFSNQNNQIVRRLNIVDPLNFSNNAGGKNIDINSLQNMFRTIYYGIHTCPIQRKSDYNQNKNQKNQIEIKQFQKQKLNQNKNIKSGRKFSLKECQISRYLVQLHNIFKVQF